VQAAALMPPAHTEAKTQQTVSVVLVVLLVLVLVVLLVLVLLVLVLVLVLVLDVEVMLVVVVVGQPAGASAPFRRNVVSSLPSLTAEPPNSVQYSSLLSVVTTATGDMLPFRSIPTCEPLQTAFASTPFLTTTTVHEAPLISLYL
jgi:hypothetical protein